MDDSQRCTATAKSTGERCKRAAVPGSNVCSMHGGKAPQVQKKAQERLDRMADSTTADMQSIISDLADLYQHADPDDRVEIAKELRKNWTAILDRTGHGKSEKRELKDVTDGDGGFGTTIVLDSEYVDDE